MTGRNMYQYELDPYNSIRRIRAGYVQREGHDTEPWVNEFEPIAFSEDDLGAKVLLGFVPSRLEVLVNLFTGEDPAQYAAQADCPHMDDTPPTVAMDECPRAKCDCEPVTIEIPPVLALHAASLQQELLGLNHRFHEWTTKEQVRVRDYRTPDGQPRQALWHQTIPSSQPPEDWETYGYLREQALYRILNDWYQQGIQLHQTWSQQQARQQADQHTG